MARQEIDNKTDSVQSGEHGSLSAMLPDLLQNDLHRQVRQSDSSAAMTKSGFPQLELIDDFKANAKSDSALHLNSKYETGSELRSKDELKQAGLDPKNVKHTVEKQDGDWTKESSSVKYPSGLEVTVNGRSKHMANGHDASTTPTATIKEPLPKGYSRDEEGGIHDEHNRRIAVINADGTVTVKIGDHYVSQSPAGITEATVIEHKDGSGILERFPK